MSGSTAISRKRAPGEPRLVKYQKTVHPGIVQRSLMLGETQDRIAEKLGVSLETLQEWMEEPAMIKAKERAMDADAKVAESIYRMALGDDKAGIKPSVAAAKFILSAKRGWTEKKEVKNVPNNQKEVTDVMTAFVNLFEGKRGSVVSGITVDSTAEHVD